jgi:hypothetical protein
MGALKFFGSLTLIALFSFAIIMFAGNFASENNSFTSTNDDATLISNRDSINSSVLVFKEDADGTLTGFYRADFVGGAESSTAPANLRVGNGSFIDMGKTTINSTYYSVFGGNPEVTIFLTALLSFLGIATVFYIWSAIKGGNVD